MVQLVPSPRKSALPVVSQTTPRCSLQTCVAGAGAVFGVQALPFQWYSDDAPSTQTSSGALPVTSMNAVGKLLLSRIGVAVQVLPFQVRSPSPVPTAHAWSSSAAQMAAKASSGALNAGVSVEPFQRRMTPRAATQVCLALPASPLIPPHCPSVTRRHPEPSKWKT